ncbi:MAG TPA: ATP-binding cassette domain-containing protein [Alphaproteobacteria bacterium]|nr:ATP-binding cassette domain-containing protein [Alphaproteobacteria bacterium]
MSSPPPLIALRGATVGFGGTPLFAGVDVALGVGDKACLVGRNGSGKSTLLKLLAGRIAPDAGERFVQPGARLAYLAQEPDLEGFGRIDAYVASGLPAAAAEERFRVDAVLDHVGLAGDRDPASLSGGEARRAALARALVGEPDVLLLDEPTNHLDLPTIEWLEATLRTYRGALLMISHDRAFLSALARRLVWMDRGSLRTLDAGFDRFESWVEETLAAEEQERHRLDRKIAAETQWAREGISARRKRNMGRVRALEQLRAERRQRPASQGVAKLDPAEATRGGTLVIEARDIAKSYPTPSGPRAIVNGFSTRILRGDRIGVIGPNGAGKTTLVKLLTGQIQPDGGSLRLGQGLEVAYFDQTRATLDPDATVRHALLPSGGDHITVGDTVKHIASYLRDFLFDPSRMDSPVKSLSGGERTRLLLARLFASPSNLLVLDEPTNDLDMETLDLLEEVLGDYKGTLILVSHDRDFLDRLVGSVIAVEGDGEAVEYVGGYADYLRQRPPRPEPPRQGAKERKPEPARPKQQTKLSYKDQRELDQLPARIEALTEEIGALERTLADPSLYGRDPAAFDAGTTRLAAARDELTAAEERWLELAALAEELGR